MKLFNKNEMRKILLIDAHPDSDRLTSSLVDAYKRGALQSGYDVRTITIRDMEFNPNLKFGYKKRINLEPDLLMAIDEIKACEHMVWFHPVWWGSLPCLLYTSPSPRDNR